MRRSDRVSERKSRNATDPLQSKRAKTVASLSLEGISGVSNIDDTAEVLWHHCLSRMPPGTWYKIVPFQGKKLSTIEYATGQSWSLLCPLLLHLKYLKIVENDLKINASKFEVLPTRCSNTVTIHYGTYRPKGSPMQHFLCRDIPLFPNPSRQVNAEKDKKYNHVSIHYFNRHDRILKNRLIDLMMIVRRKTCGYDLLSHTVAVKTSVNAREPQAPTDAITPTPSISVQELQIQNAMSLDFCQYPRPKRSIDSNITIHDRKYASKEEKVMTLLTCKNWGWDAPETTWKMKIQMARAASRLIAYDAGYRLPFGHCNLIAFDNQLKMSLCNGNESVKDYFCESRGGKIAYIDYISKKHLGCGHEFYRYVSDTVGLKASFHAMSLCMNERS